MRKHALPILDSVDDYNLIVKCSKIAARGPPLCMWELELYNRSLQTLVKFPAKFAGICYGDAIIRLFLQALPGGHDQNPTAVRKVKARVVGIVSRMSLSCHRSSTKRHDYARVRDMKLIPVKFNGDYKVNLSPGKHSELIKQIISDFAPRFTPDAQVIYVGDAGSKWGYFDNVTLKTLGVEVDGHGKMPDVVLYYKKKGGLILVEAVTSHGPVDAKRHKELEKLFSIAKPGLVYVTAFPDRKTMAKYLTEIGWETEVWVAEAPTHMIHFNGDRFLGPH